MHIIFLAEHSIEMANNLTVFGLFLFQQMIQIVFEIKRVISLFFFFVDLVPFSSTSLNVT